MEDLNIHQKAIEQLVAQGHVILQIVQPTGQILYFSVFKWQEGYKSGVQSVEFHTVEGINITDFLTKNSALFTNSVNFLSSFNDLISRSMVIKLQFAMNSIWYKWSHVH